MFAVEHRPGEREGRAAEPENAGTDAHPRPIVKLAPEVDLDAHDRDRQRAPASRIAGVGEERYARGLEEPADRGVIAMTERIEIREPNAVLDPVPIEGGVEAFVGGHVGPSRLWRLAAPVRTRRGHHP